MKNSFSIKALLIFIFACITLLSGCIVFSKGNLTPTEVAAIHNIYIEDDLGEEIQFVSIGNTLFDNDKFNIPDQDVFTEFKNEFKSELNLRGFAIVDSLSSSDYGIKLSRFKTENYPSRKGVNGAGFFIDRRYLVDQFKGTYRWKAGIEAQVAIVARLIDPSTGKERIYSTSKVTNATGLRTTGAAWPDYSGNDQKILLNELRDSLSTVPTELLNKLNLNKQ